MTTIDSTKRRSLPLLNNGPHGSRSWATCHYRCGNACDQPEPNTSGHDHIQDVITAGFARRTVLQGAGIGAGALVLSGVGGTVLASPAAAAGTGRRVSRNTWTPVAPNVRDKVTVPEGFRSRVVMAWGDKVRADAPPFDPANQTAAAASKQFGYNCDYVGLLPLSDRTALLVANHEYTNEELMFPVGFDAVEAKKIAIASHGMSVVKVRRPFAKKGKWVRASLDNPYNRRITGNTKFELTGPAVGDARLKTSKDPYGRWVKGTFNNCAGGTTPWGTVLSGEENFNQYFEASGATKAEYAEAYARYGITGSSTRGWAEVQPRFDLTREPNEPNRFGWIVEIDPYDRTSTPRKHTMLGRFKHEGANIQIAPSGQAVAYMGDDERGDYMYKFVSKNTFDPRDTQSARRRNMELLTKGTLYVARLTGDSPAATDASGNFAPSDGRFDGTGTWVPLTTHEKSFVPGFSVNDVLINTRLAADKVAPTRMDRPEDVQPNPVNKKVYAALTNNSDRAKKWPVDEANPIASSQVRSTFGGPLETKSGNRNGYVLELTEDGNNHAGRTFTWNLLLVCGEPESPETYFGGYPKEKVSPISCPDNVAFDSAGNLWISTDGNVLGSNDGLFRCPVSGPERGRVQQFLTVPVGAETCGPLITTDDKSVWIAVQHPGEGGTMAAPTSTWPHTHDFPRPGVVVTWKA